jgi:hypothetical protein
MLTPGRTSPLGPNVPIPWKRLRPVLGAIGAGRAWPLQEYPILRVAALPNA